MDAINPQQKYEAVVGIKDKYLEQLASDFALLSEIVLTQMTTIAQMLNEPISKEELIQLKRNEKIIDSLDITMKEKVINAIMLFTPRAGDLRRLMVYHDMTISMERVGDLIQNIAESVQKIDFSVDGFDGYKKNINKMFGRAHTMLKSALFAFTGADNEMAYSTILMDDKVDKMERKIEKRLAEGLGGEVHNYQVLINIMNLSLISYYIERIGDKSVDIASSAIFLLEGKDIRHTKAPHKEQETSESESE